ncbi:MAG TPA: glycosyltransferase [Candidatus Thermoplasmatota archaeon]|nr:glycosyltransferase [Candidatus Thermoplasmatota archaeon]
MVKNLRVCHLIGSLQYGGAERQVTNLINNLNVDSKYLIFLNDQQDRGFYRFLANDVRQYSVPVKLRYFYYYIMKIAKILRQNRIDVLQTHMYWANLYGVLAGKIASVPVIITTEHGKNPWKTIWHYAIERNIITKLSDLRVCVSMDILNNRRDKDGIPETKMVYLPNAVDIPTQIKKKGNKKVIVGAIGRFIEAKDYSTLIKAAGILREKGVDLELYILGDGPLRKELEADQRKLGLESVVKMPGFQDNIDEWLPKFDLFVISSIREGQPLVLLEAMSHGLAIVATNVGGIPDTLKNGEEGLLVEPGNPNLLAAAMEKLIDDESLKGLLGRKARERVKRDFSIKAICNRYEKIYLSILGSKKK